MTRKRWAVITSSLLLSALTMIALSVVLIDPFEIYRKATAFIPPITSGTQSYSNAGIARSYDYDSVIIGSSMTENFKPSELDAFFGGRFVKLCINGGTPFNHAQMMDLAFRTHDIRTVFFGLDVDSLSHFYKTPKADMPDYLYDARLLNDVQYWFNRSVLAKYIPSCLNTWGKSDPGQRDSMYSWGESFAYGKEAVLGDLVISAQAIPQEEIMADPVLSQQSRLNVEYNLIPYIEQHPDTEFIIFFAPYSLVRWYEYYRQGSLQYHLNQKEALIKRLLPYENVRIYDFHAQLQWILDLDLYVDSAHYCPEINSEIAEMISRDECRITSLDQSMRNDAVLVEYVDILRGYGYWPDTFDATP